MKYKVLTQNSEHQNFQVYLDHLANSEKKDSVAIVRRWVSKYANEDIVSWGQTSKIEINLAYFSLLNSNFWQNFFLYNMTVQNTS